LRKGSAFPRVSILTNPLSSAGRLSLPAELRRELVRGGKPEAFRKSGGRGAFSSTFEERQAKLARAAGLKTE
jgi:hypothetical protein